MSKKKQPLIANPPSQDISIKLLEIYSKIIEKNRQAFMHHDFSEHFCQGNENLEELLKKNKIENGGLAINDICSDLFLFMYALRKYGTECWIKDKAFLNKHKETLKLYFGIDIDSEITIDKIKHVQFVYSFANAYIFFALSSTIDEYLKEEAKLQPLCADLPINEIIDSLNLRIKLLDDIFTRALSPFKETCSAIDNLYESKESLSKLSLFSLSQSISYLQYDYSPCMSNNKEQYILVLEKLRKHLEEHLPAANKFRREWNRKADTPINSANEFLKRWSEITGGKCDLGNVPKSAPRQYVGILGHNATGIALDSIGRIIEYLFSQGKDRMSQYIAICDFTEAYNRAETASKLAGDSVENFSTEEWIMPFIDYIGKLHAFLIIPECCDNFSPGGFESLFKEELEKEKDKRTKRLEDNYQQARSCNLNTSDNLPELAADLRQRLKQIAYCDEEFIEKFTDELNTEVNFWDFETATEQLDWYTEKDDERLGRQVCMSTFPVLEKIIDFKSQAEAVLNLSDTYIINSSDEDEKRKRCFLLKKKVSNLKMNGTILFEHINIIIKIITKYCAKIEEELGTLYDELVAIWEQTDKSKNEKLNEITGKYKKNIDAIDESDKQKCCGFISDKITEIISDIKNDERKTLSERLSTISEILGKNDRYLSEQKRQEIESTIAEYKKEFDDGIVRAEERKMVLFEMSHHIKNLINSVTTPLQLLESELTKRQQQVVQNALCGISLIREIASGIHMSLRGTTGKWRSDILSTGGSNGVSLSDIVEHALRYAVSNMFNGKYFQKFTQNYFHNSLETYQIAKHDWDETDSIENLKVCLGKYFFQFEFNIDTQATSLQFGDSEGTATKFLILIQELLLNAVKYSSFVEKKNRAVQIDISLSEDILELSVKNSTTSKSLPEKTKGLGHVIIKNFAQLFEAKIETLCSGGTYCVDLKFNLKNEE